MNISKKHFIIFSALFFFVTGLQAQIWQWAKNTGGLKPMYPNCITTDASGNVYVAGSFNTPTITFGTKTLTNVGGNADIYLVKYSSAGNVIWAQSAGNSLDDIPHGICADNFGNIYIAGSFTSSILNFGTTTLTNAAGGQPDIFIAKFDTAGAVVWAKSAGGSGYDQAFSVTSDSSGNVYVAGSYSSTHISFGTTTYANSGNSMFMVKYDASGSVLWSTVEKDTSNGTTAFSVRTDASNNVYVAGNFNGSRVKFGSITLPNSSPAYSDMFLVKYDDTGKVVWAKSAGGDYYDGMTSMAIDKMGNIDIIGNYASDSINFDAIKLTNTVYASNDVFIVSYNADGKVRWAKSAGGNSSDQGQCIATDVSGNVYATGSFSSPSLNFGLSTLTNDTTAGNSWDIFVVKYDTSGNLITALQAGGDQTDIGDGIATDLFDNVYLSGEFNSPTLSFGGIELVKNSGSAYRDIFVSKLNGSKLSVTQLNPISTYIVFPNPANTDIFIHSADKISDVLIIDLSGKIMYTHNFNDVTARVDISNLSPGMYFLKINGGEMKKFVKE